MSPAEADVIAQAKAGADLYWAMYHVEKDLAYDMLRSDSVARAYFRAQQVFGPARA